MLIRENKFISILNIQNLQFIEQGINQDRIVSDDDEKDFIKNFNPLSKTLVFPMI